MPRFVPPVALAAAPVLTCSACLAQIDSFHEMQIEQVIAGVNGDVTKQAIQLRQRFAGQNFVAGCRVIAYDSAGLNPIVVVDCDSSVTNGGQGDRILFATANFPAPVVPDFIMSPIPASYLAAGRIVWDGFGFAYWSLAWGGASYTGPTTASVINDADGNYGPPWASPLPSTGVRALLFQGSADALSTTNAADYALTAGAAVFTNNLAQSGAIPAPCYPNCDGSTTPPAVNTGDFTCFLQQYSAAVQLGAPAQLSHYANCDGSTTFPMVNTGDFTCFLQSYAAGCP